MINWEEYNPQELTKLVAGYYDYLEVSKMVEKFNKEKLTIDDMHEYFDDIVNSDTCDNLTFLDINYKNITISINKWEEKEELEISETFEIWNEGLFEYLGIFKASDFVSLLEKYENLINKKSTH